MENVAMTTSEKAAGWPGGGDILDYLKGRGGKIRELEEQVSEHRAAQEQLASDLGQAHAQVAALQAQLQVLVAQQQSAAHKFGASPIYVAELEQLVKQHMSTELELHEQLAVAREQLATLRIAHSDLQASLAAAQREAQRAGSDAELAVRSAQAQHAARADQAEARAARAELAARSEASRAQAEAGVRLVLEAQLTQARAQLAAQHAELARWHVSTMTWCSSSSAQPMSVEEAPAAAASPNLAVALAAQHTADARAGALAQQLEAAQAQLVSARAEVQAASERATAAEARVVRLEAEADALARQVAALQEKLGRGEFSADSNIRVLHLRLNPEAGHHKQAAQSQVGALQVQVDALTASLAKTQTALESMERRAVAAEQVGRQVGAAPEAHAAAEGGLAGPVALGATTAALVQRVSGLEAEVIALRHKLSEADKASQRLKEVFKERAAAFREAVYQLFGYRVDMASEATTVTAASSATTTFSLRPQHADGPDDVLIFRYTPEEGMRLVPTPFSTTKLAREVDTFVHRFKCIPALTANLTMDSFQKQTQW